MRSRFGVLLVALGLAVAPKQATAEPVTFNLVGLVLSAEGPAERVFGSAVTVGSTIYWSTTFDPESQPFQLFSGSGIWPATTKLGAGVPNVFNAQIDVGDATALGQTGVLFGGGFDEFTQLQPYAPQEVEFSYVLSFPNGFDGSTLDGLPHLPTRPPPVSEATLNRFELLASPFLDEESPVDIVLRGTIQGITDTTTVTPEPSTLLLSLVGVVALGRRIWP